MDRGQLELLNLALELKTANMRLAVLVDRYLKMTRKRKARTVWVRHWITLRPHQGAYANLMTILRAEDVESFKNFTRLSPQMFADMAHRLNPRLQKYHTWYREPLSVGLKLAITLRYMATGDNYRSLMYLFYVPHNTISVLVKETCQAICDEYSELVKNPTTADGWKEIADVYSRRWNFHHALGALDGKHIRIKTPPDAGSTYYNYKGYNSIVLLALVDGDYKFRWVQLGAPGSCSDSQLWLESSLRQAFIDNTVDLPQPEPLPNHDRDMPYFIVADNAFALRLDMVKPFSAKPLTDEERIFNYRVSRARRCVENAFGILANRFRFLLGAMMQNTETVKTIVMACICVHNLLRILAPGDQNALLDREDDDHNIIPGSWRDDAPMDDMEERLAGNHTTRAAKMQKLYLKHYYNSPAGSVPWQERMALN